MYDNEAMTIVDTKKLLKQTIDNMEVYLQTLKSVEIS